MKVCEKAFQYLGILPKTGSEIEFDHTKAIVNDEFNRPAPPNARGSYRWSAIRRLISLRIPWHTECNIAHDVVREFVSIRCPYCHRAMTLDGGGGNGITTTTNFRCECGAKADMTFDDDHFLNFQPNEKDMEDAKDLL